MRRLAPVLIAAAGMLAMLALPASAHGQTAWYEGFEGPEPTWQIAAANAQYRIQRHQRVHGEAHTGDGCERLTLLGSGGTYVYISHEIGHPRVIDELLPTVSIKSDRPGLQLMARVVLPRTVDPRTGHPVSTLLRGFGLKRCLWKGWRSFKAYVGLGVLTYNLRLLAGHLAGA